MTETEKRKKYPTEVYSRVVGYLSNLENWNDGKQSEFEDREEYSLSKE